MRNARWSGILILPFGLALLSPACHENQTPRDTRRADERAIRAADDATKRAAQAKDANGVVDTWFADDGSAMYPNAPICTGKEALRAKWGEMLATPGFAVDWQLTKIEVSRSGDLAYTPFTYEMTMQASNGKPIRDRGKGLAVWKKQLDGSWKGEADIFNSDLPLPTPKHSPGRKHRRTRTGSKRRPHRR